MKYFLLIIMLLVNTQSLDAAKNDWEALKGTNFIVYSRNVPIDFVNTVMEEAESNYRRVIDNLGIRSYQSWRFEKRASIYIYADESDYIQNGGQAGWSHGAALVQSKTIRTFPAKNGFFDSILPHELGHIVLHEFVGIYTPIPLWFDEGVAMYQEKAKAVGAHAEVKKLIEKGKFIPLTELANMRLYADSNKDDVIVFYLESASIVNFMITQLGETRFYYLLRQLKDNRSFEDALRDVYPRARDLKALNKLWVQFLKDQ